MSKLAERLRKDADVWRLSNGGVILSPGLADELSSVLDCAESGLRSALNFIANTESEHGITLNSGDAARAALARLEGK